MDDRLKFVTLEKLSELYKTRASMLMQKARAKWKIEGDRNTKFFCKLLSRLDGTKFRFSKCSGVIGGAFTTRKLVRLFSFILEISRRVRIMSKYFPSVILIYTSSHWKNQDLSQRTFP